MPENNNDSRVYIIKLPYLAGCSKGWYRWEELAPFCVYGLNPKNAIVNALESIKTKNYPIITPYERIMSCVLMAPAGFNIDAKKVGFYIFLMIDRGRYCVVPALKKRDVKEYLSRQGIKVYDGRKILTRILKVGQCLKNKCPYKLDCKERLELSLKLCDNLTKPIAAPVAKNVEGQGVLTLW